MYQIRTVSTLTGLNSETLRAWERRYGAVVPSRDDGGRRVYTQDDVKRLTLLSNATLLGHSIGKIALLDNDALQKLLNENLAFRANTHEGLVSKIISALKVYDIENCEQLLRRGLVGMEPMLYVQDLLLPLLRQAGDLWHVGEITVAQEHLLSNTIKRIVLNLVHNQIVFSEPRKKILFTTFSGEKHEFGILMATMIASANAYRCYYLGAELPAVELIEAQKKLNAEVIVIGMVNNPLVEESEKDFYFLQEHIPRDVSIIFGGTGVSFLNLQIDRPNQFLPLHSLDDFLRTLESC